MSLTVWKIFKMKSSCSNLQGKRCSLCVVIKNLIIAITINNAGCFLVKINRTLKNNEKTNENLSENSTVIIFLSFMNKNVCNFKCKFFNSNKILDFILGGVETI